MTTSKANDWEFYSNLNLTNMLHIHKLHTFIQWRPGEQLICVNTVFEAFEGVPSASVSRATDKHDYINVNIIEIKLWILILNWLLLVQLIHNRIVPVGVRGIRVDVYVDNSMRFLRRHTLHNVQSEVHFLLLITKNERCEWKIRRKLNGTFSFLKTDVSKKHI